MRRAAAPKIASKADPREPFSIGDEAVHAGTARTIEIPIARLPPGTWTTMPVAVVRGSRPGRTVWLSGAIHGDELNGVEIVRRLLGHLRPKAMAGTILAVPIVNVFGVTTSSRYLPDGRDLNRSFPGSRRGSLASQLASLFFEHVAARCEIGLDFHTGARGRSNLPQVRCDLDDPQTRQLAEVFRPELLLHASLRDGSLRAAACKRGARVLLYEGGEADRFDEAAIRCGVDGALRVLHSLGMIDDAPSGPSTLAPCSRKSRWMRAGRSGFCHTRVELGDVVDQGQRIATISDSMDGKQLEIRARSGGIVIGLLKTALVHRGDAIVHIAEV